MTIFMTLKALRPRVSLSMWLTYNRFILRVLSFIGVGSSSGLKWVPILLLDFRYESAFRKESEASISSTKWLAYTRVFIVWE